MNQNEFTGKIKSKLLYGHELNGYFVLFVTK